MGKLWPTGQMWPPEMFYPARATLFLIRRIKNNTGYKKNKYFSIFFPLFCFISVMTYKFIDLSQIFECYVESERHWLLATLQRRVKLATELPCSCFLGMCSVVLTPSTAAAYRKMFPDSDLSWHCWFASFTLHIVKNFSPKVLSNKRKIDSECRVFKDEWTWKYLFIVFRDKPLCLIGNETVPVYKEYNII